MDFSTTFPSPVENVLTTALNRIEFPQNTFPLRNPLEWTREDVRNWLLRAMAEFSLDHFSTDGINMTGEELTRLDKRSFCSLFPENVGDVLWQHLACLIRCSLVNHASSSEREEFFYDCDDKLWGFPDSETPISRSRCEMVLPAELDSSSWRTPPTYDQFLVNQRHSCLALSLAQHSTNNTDNTSISSNISSDDDSCRSLNYSYDNRQRSYSRLPSCMYDSAPSYPQVSRCQTFPDGNNNDIIINNNNNSNNCAFNYNLEALTSPAPSSSSSSSSYFSGFDADSCLDEEDTKTIVSRSLGQGPVQLWEFLLELLLDPRLVDVIAWTGNGWEFKLVNPEGVAELWGRKKCKPRMNYEKLSRGLRYYYDKRIIVKTAGKRYVYRFVCDMRQLVHCDSPQELFFRRQTGQRNQLLQFY